MFGSSVQLFAIVSIVHLLLQRFDAADDFHDLAGDLRLAGAVVLHATAA